MGRQQERKLKAAEVQKGRLIAQPTKSDTPSTQQMKPVFSFEHLRTKYCISCCDKDQKAALADRLRELGQITWAEIQSAPRLKQGCEVIAHDSIKGDGIPSHITADMNLLAIRFCGKAPMVGYRDGRVFNVIWLDRDFTLYNH